MNDWLGIGVIIFVILCGLIGLLRATRPYNISNEEFERRAHEAPGILNAGITGLQKILDPAAGKAMEVQEDFKQGYYDGEQESGDKPEAGERSVEAEKT